MLWFFGETTSHPLSKCTWNIELEMLSFWFSSQRKIWSISQEFCDSRVRPCSFFAIFLDFRNNSECVIFTMFIPNCNFKGPLNWVIT